MRLRSFEGSGVFGLDGYLAPKTLKPQNPKNPKPIFPYSPKITCASNIFSTIAVGKTVA
jgi:hypothetical protein